MECSEDGRMMWGSMGLKNWKQKVQERKQWKEIIEQAKTQTVVELKKKKKNVCVTWHWGAFVQPMLQWKKQWVLHNPSVCIWSLWRIQCACAMLSQVACPALQYFSTLTHKRQDFRKTVTEYKTCILTSCTTFVWNISHYKKNWARYDKNIYWSLYKVPFILARF